MEETVKKRHRGRIWLIVLFLLLLALAALWFWQKENILSVKTGLQYSSGELENQLQENEQTMQYVVDASDDIVLREMSEEEKTALQNGEMSVEEVAERMVGSQEDGTAQKDGLSDYQRQLSTLIARAVAMREESVSLLDQMEAEAKAEILAIDAQERTTKAMMSVARKYISRASALETEYDNKMLRLTDEIEKLTADNHGDETLADTVLQTYIREKDLKKALYISKLQERGMTL